MTPQQIKTYRGYSIIANTIYDKDGVAIYGVAPLDYPHSTKRFKSVAEAINFIDRLEGKPTWIIETLQQELKQGQDNYNKLWDMYSELKKQKGVTNDTRS